MRFEKSGYVTQIVAVDGSTIDPENPFVRVVLSREKAAAVPASPRVFASKTPVTKPTASAVFSSSAPKALTCPPGMKLDMFGKGCEKPLDPDLKH